MGEIEERLDKILSKVRAFEQRGHTGGALASLKSGE